MTRSSRPSVYREPATVAGVERGRMLSRRPPAITPLRVAGSNHTSTDYKTNVSPGLTSEPATDLPRVVLRIPQLESVEAVIPFTEVIPNRSGKRRVLLVIIAMVIAVLGFLLLRGERPAKKRESVPPLIDGPAWKPAVTPQQQPALSWPEAASTVPPTTAKLPLPQDYLLPTPDYERYSDHYRTADGRATLDRATSGSTQPAVRFDASGIGKIIPELK
jgi:hypothetical protein